MNALQLLSQGDAVSRLVALLLLAMSVASWVIILWKSWLMRRAGADVARSTAAFWQAGSIDEAAQKIKAFDREALVLPLILATQIEANGTLAGAGNPAQQLTRVLRDALRQGVYKLQYGQVVLATAAPVVPSTPYSRFALSTHALVSTLKDEERQPLVLAQRAPHSR